MFREFTVECVTDTDKNNNWVMDPESGKPLMVPKTECSLRA
jgi:hypothetical protein